MGNAFNFAVIRGYKDVFLAFIQLFCAYARDFHLFAAANGTST
jgi:hypothetical protein